MSWEAEIEELKRRQDLAKKMGGKEKVARHVNAGKLTVRDRIEKILDESSFEEVGSVTGKAEYDVDGKLVDMQPANLITGRGRINGRRVVVAGDDFTVRGGANDAGIREKLVHVEDMAGSLRLPLVRLVDGTGGGGSVKTIETEGRTYVPAVRGWHTVIENLSKVPVVALALGSTAGLGAARVAASHYSVMVKETSQMFVAGPPVVARTGEVLTKNELGGSEIHTRNGAVDDEAGSEEEAFERARRFLSYLPPSVFELPERVETGDDPNRREDWLINAIPRDSRKVYKMRKIVEAVVDNGSFFEIGKKWGRSVITGFARLDGWPVAVLASDPYHYAGAWTADAADKVLRFVDLAQTFHLPVMHLVDIPGFLVGRQAEEQATIRHGVRAMAAIAQATVPWCAILVRKTYGVAGAAHMNSGRFNLRYAWPSGDWGSLPIAGGLEAAYKSEIEASEDPKAKLDEIEERLNRLRSPFRTAERFMIEEIIDPRDTRKLLCDFAEMAAPLREAGVSSFKVRP
ncbi:acyl-CoA carboxylase subunit beta [Sneathiella litorea]|uniref:Methylmalonyl-CoA carboxyltransferase n=1 Tax=Sneathiella litorea TaxID=2606216 RepID=A0A6L8W3U7_9PROT|nr:carboxyl transferase domain-containing protein [Sneathiella litorea]MZR29154.1 methylmalonyl-CoA carboxyltransferase [Sneathiella litorea]